MLISWRVNRYESSINRRNARKGIGEDSFNVLLKESLLKERASPMGNHDFYWSTYNAKVEDNRI